MRQLNLTKRLFWIIACLLLFSNALVTSYLYYQSQIVVETRAHARAKSLRDYFLSVRYVYQRQFVQSKIDLNDTTVGFLPIHASSLISDEFQKRSHDGIRIRNVSDRPRNAQNQANEIEQKAIAYFNANPNAEEKIELIEDTHEAFYFYSAPLRIEPFCLQCHGKKEEVIPFIAKRYDEAYDYKLGETRGIVSIIVPKKSIYDAVIDIFWKEVIFGSSLLIVLLWLMYIAIKQLTKRDVEQKKELESVVNARTKSLVEKSHELEKAYAHQKHLYSVLRTVADSNQILITTKTMDELLKKTALCLYANASFTQVKITLFKEGRLVIQEACGFGKEVEITYMEEHAFKHNGALIITPFLETLTAKDKEIIAKYGIKEAYITALRSDAFSILPLGTLSIYTTLQEGFSVEERKMIEELAGDIGFAVNSFLQKESILRLSYYDGLTNLPNKTLLSEQIQFELNATKKSQRYGALLYMDLDNFKSINDLKGHSLGDKLLIHVAQRLEKLIDKKDTLARFGGDEFAILLPNLASDLLSASKRAEEMALKILYAIKEPFVVEAYPFYLTSSIGITLFDEDSTVEKMIAQADSAMYTAKSGGRDAVRFFDATIQKIMEEKSFMLHQLRDAMDAREFVLYYQIQVNEHGQTLGVEALIRWKHPEKGFISPANFIPLCEESGLIIPVGKWVLHEALSQMLTWQTDTIKSQWRVSINVSARQFQEEDFVESVEKMIMDSNINPSLLRLELTESLLIGDTKVALEKIQKLKAIGVSLSVDDFGTGYSSLQYLKQLSVDELKIDQSFVSDFLIQKSDALIVEAILSIGNKLNMEVIAEGVETKEQFEKLKKMGCTNFQGYYFGKPILPEFI